MKCVIATYRPLSPHFPPRRSKQKCTTRGGSSIVRVGTHVPLIRVWFSRFWVYIRVCFSPILVYIRVWILPILVYFSVAFFSDSGVLLGRNLIEVSFWVDFCHKIHSAPDCRYIFGYIFHVFWYTFGYHFSRFVGIHSGLLFDPMDAHLYPIFLEDPRGYLPNTFTQML